MASVTLKNIHKLYSGSNSAAVSNFNLEVADGEFVILVGPSGCGKSTTLRMIAGLEEITEGELYIDGRLMNHVQAKDRDIAMVFQNYALYPHMTVYENMAFGLKMRKIPRDEIRRRVRQVTESMGIGGLLDRRPKALSGGERQRVALGRALVREPRVFLFDEPLSNLDARLRAQMRTEISLLHKRLGATFIYVTHDQVEAMTMADRIVIMKGGIIQQAGTPLDLYEKPCNTFVAQFIGSPQINLLDGVIKSSDAHVHVEFGEEGRFAVELPPGKAQAVSAHLGERVILGIRPEDIRCCGEFLSGTKTGLMDGVVEVCQTTGSETYLHIRCRGVALEAKISSKRQVRPGQSIVLSADPRSVHLFDARSKKAIGSMC